MTQANTQGNQSPVRIDKPERPSETFTEKLYCVLLKGEPEPSPPDKYSPVANDTSGHQLDSVERSLWTRVRPEFDKSVENLWTAQRAVAEHDTFYMAYAWHVRLDNPASDAEEQSEPLDDPPIKVDVTPPWEADSPITSLPLQLLDSYSANAYWKIDVDDQVVTITDPEDYEYRHLQPYVIELPILLREMMIELSNTEYAVRKLERERDEAKAACSVSKE